MSGSTRSGLITGLVALALVMGGCLPFPAQRGPEISGRVIDAESGEPISGAILVVRYDTRHDDLLPDRDLLGQVEVESGSDGRFVAGPIWSAGLAIWPLVRVEARVVSVIHEGHRCAGPIAVSTEEALEIALEPSADAADRRISCRPVAASPKTVPRYLAAWRGLHPESGTRANRVRDERIDRVLEARSQLGFGANCEGPVIDLAISPDGARIAFRVRESEGDWVGVVESATARPIERLQIDAPSQGRWQLGWTNPDELVLWEPTNEMARAHSLALVTIAGGTPQVVWRAPSAGPANAAHEPELSHSHDLARARWMGRSFELHRSVDPLTGLARESLRVSNPNGAAQDIGLPGEPCGSVGRFGNVQHRVGDRGRTAFDLRHVQGACRAVAVDLWSGSWSIVDDARGEGVCRESRSIPASQLEVAMAGYMDELDAALEAGGADPRASFSIRIGDEGATTVASRGYDGEIRVVDAPEFPISTPLRRIDIAVLGAGRSSSPEPREALSPL